MKLIIIRLVIPVFPGFLPLSVAIAGEYQRRIANYPPYADFNLTNRLCWDLDGTAAVSLLNDNLVLRLPDYLHSSTRTTIIGPNQLARTVETLFSYADVTSHEPRLELVPEHVIRKLPVRPIWHADEDIDNNDHVLSVPRLVTMDGPALRHYRRSVRTFWRLHQHGCAFHTLDAANPVTQEVILRVFVQRESSKTGNNPVHELLALQRLFRLAADMPLTTYGISVGGRLQAFIICEPMNRTWAIGHFWKANTNLEGIYSYLMYRTAECLQRRGFIYLNTQQDLGIPGLRAFKESLCPVIHLRKYTLWQSATQQAATRLPESLPR